MTGEGLVMFKFNGKLMQIKKALIKNDCLRISKVS